MTKTAYLFLMTLTFGIVVSAVALAESDNSGPKGKLEKSDEEAKQLEGVELGEKVFRLKACMACHSTNGRKMVAMTIKGKWGTEIELTNGKKVFYDEVFFIESIRKPNAKITKGHVCVMPAYSKADIPDDEMAGLVAFVKSLGDKEKVKESEKRTAKKRLDEMAAAQDGIISGLRFFSDDLDKIRAFYGEVLLLAELETTDGKSVAYKTGTCTIVFYKVPNMPARDENNWAWIPGETEEEGRQIPSISIGLPEEKFREAVSRGIASDIDSHKPKPNWRQSSYWGWTVKDPTGLTIELQYRPNDSPESDAPVWK